MAKSKDLDAVPDTVVRLSRRVSHHTRSSHDAVHGKRDWIAPARVRRLRPPCIRPRPFERLIKLRRCDLTLLHDEHVRVDYEGDDDIRKDDDHHHKIAEEEEVRR